MGWKSFCAGPHSPWGGNRGETLPHPHVYEANEANCCPVDPKLLVAGGEPEARGRTRRYGGPSRLSNLSSLCPHPAVLTQRGCLPPPSSRPPSSSRPPPSPSVPQNLLTPLPFPFPLRWRFCAGFATGHLAFKSAVPPRVVNWRAVLLQRARRPACLSMAEPTSR